MKNIETTKTFTAETAGEEKIKYEAPQCNSIELELESAVLQASAPGFGNGGSYERGGYNNFDYEW